MNTMNKDIEARLHLAKLRIKQQQHAAIAKEEEMISIETNHALPLKLSTNTNTFTYRTKKQLPMEVYNKDYKKQQIVMTQQKGKENTAGPDWFDMPKGPQDEKTKKDLELIRLRNILDPKRFYKKEGKDNEKMEYFQVGTIVEHATERFSSRLTRKQRKEHFIDELLADADSKKYFKKKFDAIQTRQMNRYKTAPYQKKKK